MAVTVVSPYADGGISFTHVVPELLAETVVSFVLMEMSFIRALPEFMAETVCVLTGVKCIYDDDSISYAIIIMNTASYTPREIYIPLLELHNS